MRPLSEAGRHWHDLREGGRRVALRKLARIAAAPLALIAVLALRLLRPWLLIRFYPLNSSAIGHFAVEPELYLCERDAGINVPTQRHVDLCYLGGVVCNRELARMWGRQLAIRPQALDHVAWWNEKIRGGEAHLYKTAGDERDMGDLLSGTRPHLSFTAEELRRGRATLEAMGVPAEAEFVCLHQRDAAYERAVHGTYDPIDEFRNSDVQSYVPAAEALAELGYFVLRMGAVAARRMESRHPRVIDYACSRFRDEFMDLYLGAHCLFCLGGSSGYVSVPVAFRRPVALANFAPLGYLFTYLKDCVALVKRHWHVGEGRWLSLSEIAKYGVAFGAGTAEYEARGVRLVDNSPEEIEALALEMAHRLRGTWRPAPEDEALQQRFWQLYPLGLRDEYGAVHGRVRARYGAQFLRDHPEFLR